MDGNTPVSLDDLQFSVTQPRAPSACFPRRVLRADILLLAFDALAVWDILAVVGAGYGSMVLRDFLLGYYRSGVSAGLQLTLVGAVLAAALLRGRPSRAAFDALAAASLLSAACHRFALWAALTLGAGFVTGNVRMLPRFWLVCWIVAAFALLLAGRFGLVALLRAATTRGRLRDRVAVLGAGARGVELASVADLSRPGLSHDDAGRFARAVDEIVELGRSGSLDRVIMALPDMADAPMRDALIRLKALDVEVSHCLSIPCLSMPCLSMGVHATEIGGTPLLVLAGRPLQHGGRVVKSAFDRVVALLGILFLSPVLLLAALAVLLDSPGPVIFRQLRYGWNNTPFAVLKFRTMRAAAAPGGPPGSPAGSLVQTRRGDDRVTRVGRILRTTSLDELPQLFNVLNGTMSLVGPRPHPVLMRTENQLGEEIIAEYSHRHRVKPGITGWAQIHGFRGATETAEQVRSRVEHDLFYIDNWSFALDLKILVLTPFRVVFQRSNAF